MTPLLDYLLENEPQFRKARLAALYSDFTPLYKLNPDGYVTNISAWRASLASASRAGVLPEAFSLNINSALLKELNTSEWGMPLALGTVVKESLGRRAWIDSKEFKESREGVYRSRWRVPGVGDVVGWGFRTLSGLVGTSGEGQENELLERGKVEYKVVVLENLELAATEVERRMEGHKGRPERIFSKQAFQESFKDVLAKGKGLSDGDIALLLKFMERDKGVLVTDGTTVRFKALGEKDEDGITLEDSTIASLKSLIKDLTSQIANLEKKIEGISLSAKAAVSRNNRVSALSFLRSRKLAEATLSKRHATLAQIEEVFLKIEQASDQVELVRVMEASTVVLKGLNRKVGGVERVDEVVEGLREEMSVVDEISGVIAEAGQTGEIDEAEIDGELEEMERVEREKKERIEIREREQREKLETIEREAREERHAEEIKRSLDELTKAEALAREEAARKSDTAKALDDSTELLKRITLEPNPDGTATQ